MDNRREQVRYFCKSCDKDTTFSAEISGVFIDSIQLPEPFPLIPEDRLRLCLEPECGSLWTFVEKAIKAMPEIETLEHQWSKALIVFKDFSGTQLNAKRSTHIGTA